MKVDIYRSPRDRTKFHIHPSGSKCNQCSTDPTEGEVEMPEAVYQALYDKFTKQGYAVVPQDMTVSESASSWWSIVSLLIPA